MKHEKVQYDYSAEANNKPKYHSSALKIMSSVQRVVKVNTQKPIKHIDITCLLILVQVNNSRRQELQLIVHYQTYSNQVPLKEASNSDLNLH